MRSRDAAGQRVAALVRESAGWLLLARLFECPTERWRREVTALAGEIDDPALQAAARATLDAATEGQYHSVFGPGGPASAREVGYHDGLELGSLMSELTGYYHAFGYPVVEGEPPDHVAVEIGFLAYLRLKEAYAVASGQEERAAVARDAAARFRVDHLARFAAPMAGLLAQSGLDHLAQASVLLATRIGEPPRRPLLPVIPADLLTEDDSDFPCGNS
ncbi:MAG: hypothetical protein A3F70_14585 [Acidobacteria bacterium RIFCSPLOWO2_12_FULL_67_14]|nr:MAG: hypothetical protein A3H29_10730 [Acidobacteria bacterium RIFCSPLOWO2_02_FULL_67_21]OFW36508.1 MAG: hypothetical protein A3F70_14585 [Acidobacteria bacterium RIFCSPLOWO2_12_FULL_67_14]